MNSETNLHPHSDNVPSIPIISLKPTTVPLFNFDFKRRYDGFYTNRYDRFFLRDEHVAELERITAEYNKVREDGLPVLTVSDVVNAALDFAFEHPVALARVRNPGDFRSYLAREVMLKALFHFTTNNLL